MKSPTKYLHHILEAIANIHDAISEDQDIFFKNIHIQNAVYRYFEIIGEAVKRLPKDFCDKHPQVNWREIAGLRDVIIHQYDGVDPNEVWQIIVNDLDSLEKQIKELVK